MINTEVRLYLLFFEKLILVQGIMVVVMNLLIVKLLPVKLNVLVSLVIQEMERRNARVNTIII